MIKMVFVELYKKQLLILLADITVYRRINDKLEDIYVQLVL